MRVRRLKRQPTATINRRAQDACPLASVECLANLFLLLDDCLVRSGDGQQHRIAVRQIYRNNALRWPDSSAVGNSYRCKIGYRAVDAGAAAGRKVSRADQL